jgi:membrane associated rhomboid family serine protease
MTNLSDAVVFRVFALLALLGLLSVIFLWTLSPVESHAQTIFAVYLSVDLVVFAMASYIYRVSKWKEDVGRLPLLGGCVMLLILLIVALTV